MSKYEAIILCGGKGTRVSKYTKKIPKCLIKIHGKPFLYYQLKYLKKNNINNVILSTGYLTNKIEYFVKNINFIDIKIKKDGKKLLGTGGAILNCLKFLKTNFFVIYGDSYLNFNLKKLIRQKNNSTMAIYRNYNKFDKSNVKIDKSNNVIYYRKNNNLKLQYIDYGASYINKSIFKNVKKNVKFDLSELFENISRDKMLKGYKVKKRFYEIGSYTGIKELKKFLKNK